MSKMQEQLDQYYADAGIEPVTPSPCYEGMFRRFRCPKRKCCRSICSPAGKKSSEVHFSPPVDPVKVSKWYQQSRYEGIPVPRIVVISLSAPKPEPNGTGPESSHLNPHWRGTTTTVRSLLYPFVKLDPAGGWDDVSTKAINNLFVHLRTAKCFSSLYGRRQEPRGVYENCGPYLTEEVRILKPDVVVTQGNYAHEMAGKHVFEEGAAEKKVERVRGIGTSIARIVGLKKNKRQRVYWLQSYFPFGGRFYSRKHAGAKVPGEQGVVGAMQTNLVRYGKEIERFLSDR